MNSFSTFAAYMVAFIIVVDGGTFWLARRAGIKYPWLAVAAVNMGLVMLMYVGMFIFILTRPWRHG